jgi:hypothetical protein
VRRYILLVLEQIVETGEGELPIASGTAGNAEITWPIPPTVQAVIDKAKTDPDPAVRQQAEAIGHQPQFNGVGGGFFYRSLLTQQSLRSVTHSKDGHRGATNFEQHAVLSLPLAVKELPDFAAEIVAFWGERRRQRHCFEFHDGIEQAQFPLSCGVGRAGRQPVIGFLDFGPSRIGNDNDVLHRRTSLARTK